MKVALWNGSGLDNLGDRLLDSINRRELGRRIASARFETFCPWTSAYVARRLHIDVEGYWSGEGEFDAVVIGSGSLLLGPPFRHPDLQVFFLGPYPDRFRDTCPVVWNAVCSNTQFVAALEPSWRAYVQAAARQIGLRSVRNTRTRDFLAECGVTEPVSVVPDPAVLLPHSTARKRRSPGNLRIGVIVPRPVFPTRFLRSMLQLAAEGVDCVNPDVVRAPSSTPVAEFDEQGFATRYAAVLKRREAQYRLSICAVSSIYGDDEMAVRVAAELGEDLTSFASAGETWTELYAWAQSLDCLVASRLHHCILGLAANTPVVAVDPYFDPVTGTSKLREYMMSAQGSGHYVPLEEFLTSSTTLGERVAHACATADSLCDIHLSLQRQASTHFDVLADYIGGTAASA